LPDSTVTRNIWRADACKYIKMKLLVLAILLLSLTKDVRCHGVMVLPHSWFDYPQWLPVQREGKEEWTFDFVGSKSGMQCRAGCKIPKSLICNDKYSCEGFKGAAGCSCLWYTNNTVIRKPTIFDSHFRTFARAPHQEKILFHPWRAPGSAPLASPCGVSGGNLHGTLLNGTEEVLWKLFGES